MAAMTGTLDSDLFAHCSSPKNQNSLYLLLHIG
jgi:hypothetical protein